MDIQELIREFAYNSVKLADPAPTFTLAQVRDFYSNTYPEITSAEIEGPTIVGNKQVYTFRRAVGTKGHYPEVTRSRNLDADRLKASQRPNVPMATMKNIVADLAQLEQIGWFATEEYTAGCIRAAHDAYQTASAYTPSNAHTRLFQILHEAHCSREGAPA